MEIVIKIQDKLYDLIKHYERSLEIIEEENDTLEITLMRAIINGTPLLKGHGRLIDAAELDECVGMMTTIDGESKYAIRMDDIRNMPTIIEADKEGDPE
jgi:ribulose-5-phosphate 4-epimerase/fuculose-1-phosphate aldolase